MKRFLMFLVIAIVLIGGGWWGYTNFLAADELAPGTGGAATTDGTTDVLEDDLENVIWASGKLVPERWANLSPMQSGTVKAIHVSEGDWVEQGDLLLELENSTLASQVAVASTAVGEAEAAHAQLLAGASAADLAAAQAQLAAAQAEVKLAEGRLQEAQAAVAVAQAELGIAQQQYNELASHPTEAERAAAAAEVDIAQAAVNHAQSAYNVVRGDPNIGSRPEALALQQATEQLEAAQARYVVATQGATPQQLAVAAARIEEARSSVTMAQSQIPAAEAAVEAAKAAEASAQAALQKLQTGASEEEIAISHARLRSAKAALLSAQMQLQQTRVTAPFAGQVGAVHVNVGELAPSGQPLILLGDTNIMHVETTDLRETDVARLGVAMPVEVTFDALPDRIFAGTVTKIAPVSTTDKGSTNFTVTVDVPDGDEHLRWGMTAFVNIQTK